MMAPNKTGDMDGKNMDDSYNTFARHKYAEAWYMGGIHFALPLLLYGHHYCLVYVHYPQACARLNDPVMADAEWVLNGLVTACLAMAGEDLVNDPVKVCLVMAAAGLVNAPAMDGLAMVFEHHQNDRLMAVAGLALNVRCRYYPLFSERERL